MLEVWSLLIPILMADVLNPVLFAFLVFSVSAEKPVINSTAMLLGHTVAYFSVGIGLIFVLEAISEDFANPQMLDYVISLLLGLILLWLTYKGNNKSEVDEVTYKESLTPLRSFSLGAVVNFVGIPFALPYFAAIDRILKADMIFSDSLSTLVVYNFMYAVPFAIVPLLVAAGGESRHSILQRINELLMKDSNFLMPILLGLLGAGLVFDAILFFVTGSGLF